MGEPLTSAIAFFDLDRTILDCNSATLWVRRELRLGHMGRLEALRGVGFIALYQTGLLDMEAVIVQTIRGLQGKEETPIVARTLRFWEDEVVGRIRKGGHEAVARHRSLGHRLVLLTSSSCYLGRSAATHLDLHDSLANQFEVTDGRFTGASSGPLCFGKGKLTIARRYADEQGVSLADCWFYTDSMADLPVLEAVGHPVVVHPDPRLRREALRRGWPVEAWL